MNIVNALTDFSDLAVLLPLVAALYGDRPRAEFPDASGADVHETALKCG